MQPDMFVGAAPPEPRGIVLRDYQAEALEKLRDGMRQGLRRQMLCLGTGGGKTIIAAALMEAAASKGKRAAFVADRITLVDQTSARLHEAGLAHGVSQGQNRWGHDTLIHVWSSQTMERAFQHRDVLREYDLMVVDEAHVLRKMLVENMLKSDIRTIGLSATPFSKGLGDIYQGLVNVRTTDQLVEDGWLVPFKIYVGTTIDMAGAKTTGGEWRDSEVSERTLPVIGDIVSEWRKKTHEVFGEGRTPKTLVFSASVANGADLCREFQNIGVRAEQISYRDRDDAVRREKIALFEAGEIDVLTAVDALSKGFDVPSVECIVMARPFRRSLTSIIQQLGRGMRIADSKPYCLLLDNARNYIRFADRIEAFWAHGLSNLDTATLEEQREPSTKEDEERVCPQCFFVWPKGAQECPSCGYRSVPKHRAETAPGTLAEYQRGAAPDGEVFDWDIWPDVSAYATQRHPLDQDRALKYARVQFKTIMGRWPRWGRVLEPGAVCDHRVEATIRKNLSEWIKRNAWKKKQPAA